MTPRERDRNVFRARRITSAIAGAALAACGLFAGLAASATRHAVKATPTTTASTTTTAKAQTTTTPAATTTIAPVVVTPTQSAPVASSGGS
jgi:multidrug efflux pump subunit AcrA (membrane-fusion protein)